ncbi:MAG: hypothetical protein R3337_08760 [Gammaproteobacteria bacterium]|nr:hypothetical protein [Gammaproteobacteria bacterium]
MTVRVLTVIAAALGLLTGCALEQKGQWVKPGVTEAQWKRDNYECTRDATYYEAWAPFYPNHWSDSPWGPRGRFVSTAPRLDSHLYEMCLEAKGYSWKPEQ